MTCPRCHCSHCHEEREAATGDAIVDGVLALLTRLRDHVNGTNPLPTPTSEETRP